jgi:hypothetical protein
MSNPKSGGTGLRRFYLADFARQTKAWYKGLSFRKGPPPRSSLPAVKLPERLLEPVQDPARACFNRASVSSGHRTGIN